MLTQSGEEIAAHAVTQIVQSVFSTMLGLEVTRRHIPWAEASQRVTSLVHLTGAWNVSVIFECDRSQAENFACRFLSLDSGEADGGMVCDVLGELANMIGGNLKCVLGKGIDLSMPTVVDGSEYLLRVCGAEVEDRAAFESSQGAFWVTVLTRDPGDAIPVPA